MSVDQSLPRFDAIVLAGGASARLGGADKALVTIGTLTLLDRALAAVSDADEVVVVGPPRSTTARAVFTQEEPPGSGPASALAHALQFVRSSIVVVLAVDVPFAKRAIPRLLAALPGHDAAMLVSARRRQPLIAAYSTAALRARAAAGPWANRSIRALVEPLFVAEVPAESVEVLDCDTPDDVTRANRARDQFDGSSSEAGST